MFIKTVSTTSGINPIKFDETGGVFYWILNTGLSTIYASTKSTFTAGDDGVVSLGPKESRRLETNNDTIYILGAGQVEIHNQRDGICSFKQAPTSSGSGGGGTIDAYSKTESDAKYAQKTDIPTSLPANGGNADTLDGLHADDFAKSTNPRINGDMIFKSDSNQQTLNAIYSAQDMLVLRNTTKDFSSLCDVMISNDGVRIVNATQNFKIGDGGNADTVDNKHATDFITGETLHQRTTIDDCTIGGTYAVSPEYTTDMPTQYGHWGICDVRVYGLGIFQTIKYTDIAIVICRSKIEGQTEWSEWKEISTTPIKKMTFPSVATNAGGGGALFLATFGTPITIACTSRDDTQCTPFFASNQWLVLAKDAITLDPIPEGSYSFDVWYI